MKVSAITGGPQDSILLTAETLRECRDLVAVGLSTFLPPGAVILIAESPVLVDTSVALKILVSPKREATPAEQATVNAEHDAEA